MENNTTNNIVSNPSKKKSGLITIILIIILIAIAALIYVKRMQNAPLPLTQSEVELNKAVESDTTASINSSLDSIKIEDTSTTDLEGVDKELQNL